MPSAKATIVTTIGIPQQIPRVTPNSLRRKARREAAWWKNLQGGLETGEGQAGEQRKAES